VPDEGFEPPTFGLQNRCSTTELIRQIGAFLAFLVEIATGSFQKAASIMVAAPLAGVVKQVTAYAQGDRRVCMPQAPPTSQTIRSAPSRYQQRTGHSFRTMEACNEWLLCSETHPNVALRVALSPVHPDHAEARAQGSTPRL
jgi:hypothetical protein